MYTHSIGGSRVTRGFTLMEFIFTIVILAILTKFAMMKLVTPGTMTLQAQAQAVADTVRRAQSLAMNRSRRMSVSATGGSNGSVAIACVGGSCNTDTSYSLSQGVSLASSASPIYFNSRGEPINNAGSRLNADTTYTVSYTTASSTKTYTITVAQITGRVSISP
jgi:MSHA pilin protein MshC